MVRSSSARLLRLIATSGWSGPAAALLDRQSPAKQRLGVCHPVRGFEQKRQVVEFGRDYGVVRTVQLLVDRQRAARQRLGLRHAIAGLEEHRQVVEAYGDVGAVRAVGPLGDGKRPAKKRLGLRHPVCVLKQLCQVVDDHGDSRGVRPAVGFAESLAIPQQRLGFGITGKITQHRGCRDRGVGPGFPLCRRVGIGQRHGPLECGEGAHVPFRLGRTTELGQGRSAFEHRQLAALLFLLVGRLQDRVEISLGQRRSCCVNGRWDRPGRRRGNLAVDQGFDLLQRELDHGGQFLEGAMPRFFRCDFLVGQQSLEQPLSDLLFDLLDLYSLLTRVFGRDSFALLLARLFLLSPLLDFLFRSRFLESPLRRLLLEDDQAHRPQGRGYQDSNEDEPPPQAFSWDIDLLVDLLKLALEPLDLQPQAADFLVELLDRGRGVVVPAGRTSGSRWACCNSRSSAGSGLCGSAGKPSPVRKT